MSQSTRNDFKVEVEGAGQRYPQGRVREALRAREAGADRGCASRGDAVAAGRGAPPAVHAAPVPDGGELGLVLEHDVQSGLELDLGDEAGVLALELADRGLEGAEVRVAALAGAAGGIAVAGLAARQALGLGERGDGGLEQRGLAVPDERVQPRELGCGVRRRVRVLHCGRRRKRVAFLVDTGFLAGFFLDKRPVRSGVFY